MFRTIAVGALVVAALGPSTLSGQDWQEVTSFRQRASESALAVDVRYGAGTLLIEPGAAEELYRVGMRYDSDVFEPLTKYDSGRLEVGVEGRGSGIDMNNNETGEMRLALSPVVPLDLDLEFGAVDADLELGGLRISAISLETGASDTEIIFSRPNPIACERLEISMGAAALRARGLANANCARVTFEGGVGDVTLDFSGEWRRDMAADLTIALGSAKLLVPEDIGVRVEKETFLTDFDRSRFEERDGIYYSSNWESASRRLTVDAEGAFGSIEIRWIS